jgi:hypothetical protein
LKETALLWIIGFDMLTAEFGSMSAFANPSLAVVALMAVVSKTVM